MLEQSHHHIQNAVRIKPAKNMLAGAVVFYQLVQAAGEVLVIAKLRPMDVLVCVCVCVCT